MVEDPGDAGSQMELGDESIVEVEVFDGSQGSDQKSLHLYLTTFCFCTSLYL